MKFINCVKYGTQQVCLSKISKADYSQVWKDTREDTGLSPMTGHGVPEGRRLKQGQLAHGKRNYSLLLI